jgi:SAM-dependent methyltransferase
MTQFTGDPVGAAILEYAEKKRPADIIVSSDICDDDIIPLEVLFRTFDEMPMIEQLALDRCKGKVLDVGAGSGTHSLELSDRGHDVLSIDISKGAVDYMKRNGFPLMVRSTKGKGSVNEGVEFIKSYDVVIHPRCKTTEKEFMYYAYKIDPKTEEVLPQLKDDNNHIIDAVRYALELVRKAERRKGGVSAQGPIIIE